MGGRDSEETGHHRWEMHPARWGVRGGGGLGASAQGDSRHRE